MQGHLGNTGGKTWDNPQNAALEQTLQNLSVWSLQNPSQPLNTPARSNILQPYSFEGDVNVNPGNRVQQPVQNYMPITREGHSDVTAQFLQQDNRSRPGLGEWHGGLWETIIGMGPSLREVQNLVNGVRDASRLSWSFGKTYYGTLRRGRMTIDRKCFFWCVYEWWVVMSILW